MISQNGKMVPWHPTSRGYVPWIRREQSVDDLNNTRSGGKLGGRYRKSIQVVAVLGGLVLLVIAVSLRLPFAPDNEEDSESGGPQSIDKSAIRLSAWRRIEPHMTNADEASAQAIEN